MIGEHPSNDPMGIWWMRTLPGIGGAAGITSVDTWLFPADPDYANEPKLLFTFDVDGRSTFLRRAVVCR
jgi:hypothetical protein